MRVGFTERQEFDESVAAINEDTIDHACFGCGNGNPQGLRLRFRPLANDGVWARFTPALEHQGYLGLTHGGILATLADEAMSWAITHAGDLAVTARMSLTFRTPARIGEPLVVMAKIIRRRGRMIDTIAEVRNAGNGAILVEAEGRFLRVSAEQAAEWREAYGDGIESTTFGAAARRNADMR